MTSRIIRGAPETAVFGASVARTDASRHSAAWAAVGSRPSAREFDSPGRRLTFIFYPIVEGKRFGEVTIPRPPNVLQPAIGASLFALPEAAGNRHDLSECKWRNLEASLGI
jgi:hypothetical protein